MFSKMEHSPLKKLSYLIVFVILLISTGKTWAQATNVPLNEDYYHWIDRYEVKSGRVFPQIFTSVKPYRRSDVLDFVDSAAAHGLFQSRSDLFNLKFLRNDSGECSDSSQNISKKTWLKHYYRAATDFLHVNTKYLDVTRL